MYKVFLDTPIEIISCLRIKRWEFGILVHGIFPFGGSDPLDIGEFSSEKMVLVEEESCHCGGHRQPNVPTHVPNPHAELG